MRTPSKKKATIYDLSVISGSSASTVSAVLNGTWRRRRIKESTAERILELAREQNYTANMQARGLRSSKSGLVALLLPVHDNRYFSSMAQTFDSYVRNRGQCPIVVSTCRDPYEELRTVETLISYSVDTLLIAGATDPDGIHGLCESAGLKHINIDLPGRSGPSVITDNYAGAVDLTRSIIDGFSESNPLQASELYMFGGRDDHNSRERERGFKDVKTDCFGAHVDECIIPTGYSPTNAQKAFEEFYHQHGKLPRGLFVNSTINYEGLLRFMAQYPAETFADLVVGCFDYDPFGSFLPFRVTMIRQDVEQMIDRAFQLIDSGQMTPHTYLIPPQFVAPRNALTGPLDSIRDMP
ncbi:LacI family DNA-binding transcriptional regulator [Thalassospira marina]|uniref:LacI family transcriptional regulator n=1 Tax=Thalassospira marina TaxID=2048283 RepID=A0ABN5FKU2_9PROT|nr:LacI family DNA-binding transcriptional regulator [Thalassospira marina]AUG55633.1 LacI family transcriptional regulator [Thalassospira marina]